MDPERWRAVRSLFDEMVELEPRERAGRLAALGAADPDLRREVEALLEADAGAEGRLAGLMFGLADPLGLVGRAISHFRVLQPLGAGGMGVVYTAEDTRLNRPVALKFPLPSHRLDSSAKQRFLHEARSAAALDHPNLCSIYEVGESEDGLIFLAMALYRGETLRARLAREGPLPVHQVMEFGRQIAQGLAAAHQAGIVHRDLKPGNVMVLSDDTVKILDFGLAKVRDVSLTGSRGMLGTAAYMAPEQFREAPVDGRTDLWALGVVLYEMLTGQQPFRGEHEVSIGHAILHEEPIRPSELRPDIPGPVEDLVLTLLSKDPARRHAAAGEVSSEIAAIQRGDQAPVRRARPKRAASRTVLAAVGALLLMSGALAAFLSLRPEPARFEPNLLAIAPFDVADSSLQLWREGLVDILSLDLDGAGPLRTVAQTVVLNRWSGRADRASAAELGQRTGAELVVFGNVVRQGSDSVGLRVAVLDRSGNTVVRDLVVVGEEGRMGELADSLGFEILRALGQGRPIGAMREVTIGARSLPALKAFLRGEQFYRGGHWDSALVHYDQAVAQDPDFALALRHMVRVIDWAPATASRYRPAPEYLRRAVALNRRLPPRDSLLLLADSFKLSANRSAELGREGNTDVARDPGSVLRDLYAPIEILEEAARRYPGDPEILFELGEARYHWAPLIGIPANRALEALDRAIALDPGFSPAYEHTVELALQVRRPDLAAQYARTGAALAAGYQAPHLRLAALVLDSGIGTAGVARALAAASATALVRVGDDHLTWATDSSEAAVAVLRELAGPRPAAVDAPVVTEPVVNRNRLEWALAFRGHLREAANLGTAPPVRFARLAALFDPFLELALFGAVPDSLAHRAFRGALAPDANWGWPPDLLPPRYLRGAPWWLARGDTGALHLLASRAARAARESRPPVAVLRGRYLHATATAYLALARGDSLRAAQLLQAIPDSLCLVVLCFHEKVTLARLFVARGADREAASLLDRWGETAGSTPSAVLAALERARIAERLSDTATARDRYQFVAEAWRDADPELQAYVAEARAAHERLQGLSR